MNIRTFIAVAVICQMGGGDCRLPVVRAQELAQSPAPWTKHVICEVPREIEGDILVSTRGDHWCCRVKKDDGQTVVGDGNYSPQVYRKVGNLELSVASGRCAFSAQKKDGSWVVVVDGKEYPTQALAGAVVEWSPDGNRWMAAWFEARGGNRGDSVIIVDGKEVGRHYDITWPIWSSDSGHYGYLARDTMISPIEIIVDGKSAKHLGHGFEATLGMYVHGPNIKATMAFLKGGSVAAVAPIDDKPWAVFKGQKVMATYGTSLLQVGDTLLNFQDGEKKPAVSPRSLTVSADGSTVAWWGRPGGKNTEWFCYVDGRQVGGSKDVSPTSDRIHLSPDGKRVAFVLRTWTGEGDNRKTTSARPCIDGKAAKDYAWVSWFTFSPDSRRCAYRAQPLGKKGWVYVVDGKELGEEAVNVWTFCFSPSGENHAYCAERSGEEFLVYNGKEFRTGCQSHWNLSFVNETKVQFLAKGEGKVFLVQGCPR